MTSWLISGGAGFLGRALTRSLLAETDIERIVIYSRGEHAQAQARDSIDDPDGRVRWMIGDVRDRNRLHWACRGVDVVIHAAALKRIEVGAYAPSEMVMTNIVGTMNLIDACHAENVSCALLVSSDKAWQPISPYGQSKATAEALWLAGNCEHVGPRYSVVRYGNVWGSTGSVIHRWRRAKRLGERASMTNPECTRFFMRVAESVDLIWKVVHTMRGGELVVPETLPAYRLGDLADAMDLQYDITGLPAHEKVHEGMRDGLTSDSARRMTVEELRAIVAEME